MAFEWASWLENNHIIVHAADLQLNPPQSYLFVQDFLIILCALLYCFCYVFYTLRTKRDRFLAGPVDLLYVHLFRATATSPSMTYLKTLLGSATWPTSCTIHSSWRAASSSSPDASSGSCWT